MNAILDRIAALRGDVALTRFCRDVGINYDKFKKTLQRRTMPDPITLLSIARHFHVDLAWLVSGKSRASVLNAQIGQCLKSLRRQRGWSESDLARYRHRFHVRPESHEFLAISGDVPGRANERSQELLGVPASTHERAEVDSHEGTVWRNRFSDRCCRATVECGELLLQPLPRHACIVDGVFAAHRGLVDELIKVLNLEAGVARDLFADHSKALDAIESVGGDASVARLEEERQTILLDIEEKALRHIRLKVGIAAAGRALHAYRDKHRNSMMIEASNAFHTISRGAYTSLTTRPDKDSEVLIGLAASGGSKLAAEMSKGTRLISAMAEMK